MIVAQEKKKTNIAEYLIYMFKIEDIIRAYQLDLELIKKHVVNQFTISASEKETLTVWYEGLIEQMKSEGISERGHLQFIQNQINDLEDLHRYLIQQQNPEYLQLYSWAKSNITHLKSKNSNPNCSEIEACFSGLYGILVLKLQQREISKDTQDAIESISKMLAKLNQIYFKIERGEMEIRK